MSLADIEFTIESLKARQLKARKFQKLMANREFKELILEDYLKDEPARITTLLVSLFISTDGYLSCSRAFAVSGTSVQYC